MPRNRPKMSRDARKTLRENTRLDREKDTIYWLVFEPKPGISVPTKEEFDLWSDPWRVRLLGNPKRQPEIIEAAIREFESKHNVKSWTEIAIRHYSDELYYP